MGMAMFADINDTDYRTAVDRDPATVRYYDHSKPRTRDGNNKVHRSKRERKTQAKLAKLSRKRNRK